MGAARLASLALLAASIAIAAVSASKCTKNGQRCAGAPGRKYVKYHGCCDPEAKCVEDESMGWGRFCKVPSVYSKTEPTCYKENERCMGEEGYEYVDYKDCCSEDMWCAKDDKLGWGYHCKKIPGYGKYHTPVTTSAPSYDYKYGHPTAAPVTSTKHTKSHGYYYHPYTAAPVVTTKPKPSHGYKKQPYTHAPPTTVSPAKYGYSESDTVDNNGYYAGYYYGKDMSGQAPNDPFAAFGPTFGCAGPGEAAMADDPLPAILSNEFDIFVELTITSCNTDVDTFTNADAEAVLASLCASARLLDPTAQCRIYAVVPAASSPVRMAAETLNRQAPAPAGVTLGIQIRCDSTTAGAITAALTVVIGPAGGIVSFTATISVGTSPPVTVAPTDAPTTAAPLDSTTTAATTDTDTTTSSSDSTTTTTAAPSDSTTTTAPSDAPSTATTMTTATTVTTATTTTTVTTTTTATMTTAAGCTADATVLNQHNAARADVNVGPLTWDCDLEASAQAYAESMAARNSMVHSPESNAGSVGENIASGFASQNGVPLERSTLFFADLWYQEIENFQWGTFPDVMTPAAAAANAADPDDGVVGHYTAMVWSTTTRMGCGIATATNGFQYYCCQYLEPGNVIGREVYPQIV